MDSFLYRLVLLMTLENVFFDEIRSNPLKKNENERLGEQEEG